MEVAFPAEVDQGINSLVHNHFGTAHFFIIAETDTHTTETLINPDRNHPHGKCQPLSMLGGKKVAAVAVGTIGPTALSKLRGEGIKIYRAVEGTVLENLELVKSYLLPEVLPGQTCSGHDHKGNCMH